MERATNPYITIRENTVLGIGLGFLDLTGFKAEDLLNISLIRLLHELLKITVDVSDLLPFYESVFIFTKDLKPKEVDISVIRHETTADIYFIEKPDNGMDRLLPALLGRIDHLEKQNRQMKLIESNLKIITEYMTDALCIINKDGTYAYYNEQAIKSIPVPHKIKKVGDSLSFTTYTDLNGRILTKDELPHIRVTKGEVLENVRIRVDGPINPGYYSFNGCPIYDENGELTSAVICFRDITKIYEYEKKIYEQKKQLEAVVESLKEQKSLLELTIKKLRQSEMQLQMASESARAGIYAFDFIKKEGYWSPMFHVIHGLNEDDPVTLDENNIYIGLHPDDRQLFIEAVTKANNPKGNGLADIDYRIVTPQGQTRWMHMRGQTHFTGEGQDKRPSVAGGVVIDITDRMTAEKNVTKLSQELRNVINTTEDIIWSVDKDGKLLYCNTAFQDAIRKIFGCTLTEGAPLKEVIPADLSDWIDLYERAIKDGKFQVDLTTPFNDRIISYYFYPAYENAEVTSITCFAKDITERMKTEQKIVNENAALESTVRERTAELQQMVKNLQNFSLALTHDVKASYREIEVCAGKILENTNVSVNADRILQISTDMTSFILEIMKYEMCSRRTLEKKKVNIKKLFTTVYKELKGHYTNQSRLAFETGFPIILADEILLQQVVTNIMSNALKFSSKRDMAIITIGCREENSEYVFYVEDNGVGFDNSGTSKLFYPFERLHDKEDFEGNGLGLSIVKNIIQRHGGRTWIESETDNKTVIYFSLPIS